MERSREPEAFTAFERLGWGGQIDGYQRTFARLTAQTVPAMLEAGRVMRGHRVLDVCTGHGVLAAAALERGAAVSGLDFAEAVVSAAMRNVPGATFRQGDAQALPYPDASFEAVLCGYGLIHLSDPAVALAEMVRVLAPGGRLAASAWERPEPDNGFGLGAGARPSRRRAAARTRLLPVQRARAHAGGAVHRRPRRRRGRHRAAGMAVRCARGFRRGDARRRGAGESAPGGP